MGKASTARRQLPVVPRQPGPERDPEILAAIDALEAHLPAFECRGQCQGACQGISMSQAEERRIAERGVMIAPRLLPGMPLRKCAALTMFGQCGVYDVRPAVCKLWGLVKTMQCAYGCVPEGGFLDERSGRAYIDAAMRIGYGYVTTFEEQYELLVAYDDPEVLHAYSQDMAARSNDYSDTIRRIMSARLENALTVWEQRNRGGRG